MTYTIKYYKNRIYTENLLKEKNVKLTMEKLESILIHDGDELESYEDYIKVITNELLFIDCGTDNKCCCLYINIKKFGI